MVTSAYLCIIFAFQFDIEKILKQRKDRLKWSVYSLSLSIIEWCVILPEWWHINIILIAKGSSFIISDNQSTHNYVYYVYYHEQSTEFLWYFSFSFRSDCTVQVCKHTCEMCMIQIGWHLVYSASINHVNVWYGICLRTKKSSGCVSKCYTCVTREIQWKSGY